MKTRVLVALFAFVALAVSANAQCANGAPPPCTPPAPVRVAPPHPTSVAVLPLQNRSPDSADVYLADGLTDEVGNRLTQLGRLQIKGRGLVDAQWRRTPDQLTTARRLNVAYYVQGHVRRAGAQLIVNIELVRVATGDEVMASRFVRPAGDVFAVQAEVAESIAVLVGGRLSPIEKAALTKRPTRDNEAYRLYVYGNALLKRRTQDDVRAALAAYAEATRRDPGFAAAWAMMGNAYGVQYTWGWNEGIPRDSLTALTRAAGRRALALDTLSADVWSVMASAAFHDGDIAAAHRSCTRASQLDSLRAEIWHLCGTMYGGYFPAVYNATLAEPWLRRAVALDPDMRNTWRHLARLRQDEGRLSEAELLLDTALAIAPWPPAFTDRAFVRFMLGNRAGALADIVEAERLTGGRNTGIRALFALADGDSTAAQARLAEAVENAAMGQVSSELAFWSMALGKHGDALAALERSRAVPDSLEPQCAPGVPCSASIQTWRTLHNPIYAPLRGEPRFIRLMNETKPRIPWLQ